MNIHDMQTLQASRLASVMLTLTLALAACVEGLRFLCFHLHIRQ